MTNDDSDPCFAFLRCHCEVYGAVTSQKGVRCLLFYASKVKKLQKDNRKEIAID